jgi:hypothetical protein
MNRSSKQHHSSFVCKDSLTLSRQPRLKQEVFREVCDWYGERISILHAPYDGTIEDALRVAERITECMYRVYHEARSVESRIGATDEHGRAIWVIAPNFQHVAEVGTPEAAYIEGDLSFA